MRYGVQEVIVVMSMYFLGLEMLQIKAEGLGYFNSVWNFIDLIPPLIQISIVFLTYQGIINDMTDVNQKTSIAILLSIASLCLWFRFLYFLRIFDGTGFLIRAILAVIVDMKYFFLILMITIIAFGDSFKVMSLANSDKDAFVPGGTLF